MTLKFGTDGVRGDADQVLTCSVVRALGQAAAEVLGAEKLAVGYDPRHSGPRVARALRKGVRAGGSLPVDLGVLPTPAVARWCGDEDMAGAMVSASHNGWRDNGVKFFTSDGYKLDGETERAIELRVNRAQRSAERSPDVGVGGWDDTDSAGHTAEGKLAAQRHQQAVVDSVEGRPLAGMRVVTDCGNGAASYYGPDCLRELGAIVDPIHDEPTGRNINDACGSLHPDHLMETVTSSNADVGLAFDGDADRVLAVDQDGELIDGDQILAICALDRLRRGLLKGSAVVVTVMSNLGLRRAMKSHGISVVDTAVGDRNVFAALEEYDLVLGGEQSGHLIFRDLATTGDGLLTAVQLLDAVRRSGRSIGDLATTSMTRLPQALVGVPIPVPEAGGDLDRLLGPIAAAGAQRLGDHGRVLVRPSGTEPIVRVMVEASDEDVAVAEAERLAACVAKAVSCQ